MSRPEPIGRALKSALRGLDLDQRLRESQAMAQWGAIVGEVTASRTRPLHVNRGTLVVQVASSAWAQQLNLLKPRLLEAIEAKVGPGVIRDLRWRSGVLEDGAAPDGERYVKPASKPKEAAEPPLAAAELEAIARVVRGVTDDRLADALERVLVASARRKRRLAARGWLACQRCGCLHDPEAERAPGPLAASRLCPVCRLELEPVVRPAEAGSGS